MTFIELTSNTYGTPVMLNPRSVALVEGRVVHLHGGYAINVKEEYGEIQRRICDALGLEVPREVDD